MYYNFNEMLLTVKMRFMTCQGSNLTKNSKKSFQKSDRGWIIPLFSWSLREGCGIFHPFLLLKPNFENSGYQQLVLKEFR